MLRLQNSGLEAMDLFRVVGEDYGLDPDASYPTSEEAQVCVLQTEMGTPQTEPLE